MIGANGDDGNGAALGILADAPATTLRSLAVKGRSERERRGGAELVLAALDSNRVDAREMRALRLFGEWSPAGKQELRLPRPSLSPLPPP